MCNVVQVSSKSHQRAPASCRRSRSLFDLGRNFAQIAQFDAGSVKLEVPLALGGPPRGVRSRFFGLSKEGVASSGASFDNLSFESPLDDPIPRDLRLVRQSWPCRRTSPLWQDASVSVCVCVCAEATSMQYGTKPCVGQSRVGAPPRFPHMIDAVGATVQRAWLHEHLGKHCRRHESKLVSIDISCCRSEVTALASPGPSRRRVAHACR